LMKTADAIPSSVEEARKEWAREAMSSQILVSHGKVRPGRVEGVRDIEVNSFADSFFWANILAY
jgi:hypothetical protein